MQATIDESNKHNRHLLSGATASSSAIHRHDSDDEVVSCLRPVSLYLLDLGLSVS
jgi:hypothetical protein